MQIPAGFAEVTFCARVSAGYREQMTSLGFQVAGFDPVTGPNVINVAWGVFVNAIGWNALSPIRTLVKIGTADPSAPLTYESASGSAGSGSNQVTQPQVSMLAVKRTSLGGRSGRGRMFLPQPIEGSVDKTGTLESIYATNVQLALDDLVADTATELGGNAFLLHADAAAPNAISSLTLSDKVATQRRRNDRG